MLCAWYIAEQHVWLTFYAKYDYVHILPCLVLSRCHHASIWYESLYDCSIHMCLTWCYMLVNQSLFSLLMSCFPAVLCDTLSSSGSPARDCFYSCKVGVHYSCFHVWCGPLLHPSCAIKNLWFTHRRIQLRTSSNYNSCISCCSVCYLDYVWEEGIERQVEVSEASTFPMRTRFWALVCITILLFCSPRVRFTFD